MNTEPFCIRSTQKKKKTELSSSGTLLTYPHTFFVNLNHGGALAPKRKKSQFATGLKLSLSNTFFRKREELERVGI